MIEAQDGNITPQVQSIEVPASQVNLETGHIWLDDQRVFFGAWVVCALAGATVGWFLQHPVVGAGVGALAWPAITYFASAQEDMSYYPHLNE